MKKHSFKKRTADTHEQAVLHCFILNSKTFVIKVAHKARIRQYIQHNASAPYAKIGNCRVLGYCHPSTH